MEKQRGSFLDIFPGLPKEWFEKKELALFFEKEEKSIIDCFKNVWEDEENTVSNLVFKRIVLDQERKETVGDEMFVCYFSVSYGKSSTKDDSTLGYFSAPYGKSPDKDDSTLPSFLSTKEEEEEEEQIEEKPSNIFIYWQVVCNRPMVEQMNDYHLFAGIDDFFSEDPALSIGGIVSDNEFTRACLDCICKESSELQKSIAHTYSTKYKTIAIRSLRDLWD